MNLIELSGDFCNNYLYYLKKASSKLNLTLSQVLCLTTIPYDGISQSMLAKKLALDLSTLSRNLNKLIDIGLIQKENSHYDKRSYNISLTSSGKNIYNKILNLVQSDLNTIINHLDPEEQDGMLPKLS